MRRIGASTAVASACALAGAGCGSMGYGGGGSASTQATTAAASNAGGHTLTIGEKEWAISVPAVTVRHGVRYTIVVHNDGTIDHDLLIDGNGLSDRGIHNASPVPPGSSKTFAVVFPNAGSYTLYCAIPGHRANGMVHTLKVT
jgi:uncharacterized cupredoxin-like copper-binding protein